MEPAGRKRFGRAAKPYAILTLILLAVYAGIVVIVGLNQRSLIYFPTHAAVQTSFAPWIVDGKIVGYCRAVESPRTIWLMTHGNGGQSAHRSYVLPHLSARDALYVLEYPGYGLRTGTISKDSFNQAAAEAFHVLKRDFPKIPVCAVGESIGSGPAASLATLPQPPEKIVLIVPFDTLASVAAEHMPLLPVRALLRDDWNNIDALKHFSGPIEIYGAQEDQIIGFDHAKNLAAQLPHAKFVAIPGGHNDWSKSELVRIEK